MLNPNPESVDGVSVEGLYVHLANWRFARTLQPVSKCEAAVERTDAGLQRVSRIYEVTYLSPVVVRPPDERQHRLSRSLILHERPLHTPDECLVVGMGVRSRYRRNSKAAKDAAEHQQEAVPVP